MEFASARPGANKHMIAAIPRTDNDARLTTLLITVTSNSNSINSNFDAYSALHGFCRQRWGAARRRKTSPLAGRQKTGNLPSAKCFESFELLKRSPGTTEVFMRRRSNSEAHTRPVPKITRDAGSEIQRSIDWTISAYLIARLAPARPWTNCKWPRLQLLSTTRANLQCYRHAPRQRIDLNQARDAFPARAFFDLDQTRDALSSRDLRATPIPGPDFTWFPGNAERSMFGCHRKSSYRKTDCPSWMYLRM